MLIRCECSLQTPHSLELHPIAAYMQLVASSMLYSPHQLQCSDSLLKERREGNWEGNWTQINSQKLIQQRIWWPALVNKQTFETCFWVPNIVTIICVVTVGSCPLLKHYSSCTAPLQFFTCRSLSFIDLLIYLFIYWPHWSACVYLPRVFATNSSWNGLLCCT